MNIKAHEYTTAIQKQSSRRPFLRDDFTSSNISEIVMHMTAHESYHQQPIEIKLKFR